MVSNKNILFRWSIFRGYVSFPEGNFLVPKNSFAQLPCQSQHLGLSPHGAYPYHLDHRGSPALAENCPVDVTTIMNCNCMIMNNHVYTHAYKTFVYIPYVNIYIYIRFGMYIWISPEYPTKIFMFTNVPMELGHGEGLIPSQLVCKISAAKVIGNLLLWL